jgi:hypothetical protein
MVPADFVRLDRAAAHAERQGGPPGAPGARPPPSRGTPLHAPRDPTEELVAADLRGVLRRERVGIHDDFFELGGHSIQSIRISYEANQHGLRLSPRDLFLNPTVAHLARFLATEAGAAEEEEFEEGVL